MMIFLGKRPAIVIMVGPPPSPPLPLLLLLLLLLFFCHYTTTTYVLPTATLPNLPHCHPIYIWHDQLPSSIISKSTIAFMFSSLLENLVLLKFLFEFNFFLFISDINLHLKSCRFQKGFASFIFKVHLSECWPSQREMWKR